MNSPTTDTSEPTQGGIEDLQLEISGKLPKLLALVPLVAALADSHQAGVGFMSYDARQIENAMARKDHRLQIEAEILGRPLGHGATAAPGNLAAISVYVEICTSAQHQVWRLTRALARTGVTFKLEPVDDQVPVAGATAVQLLRMLRPLVWATSDLRLLQSVASDLTHVETAALRVVDGPDEAYYPGVLCPHCGRASLLAKFKDAVVESVTCDKDQTTGKRHACTCSDPLCECKERPIAHRHVWYRTRGNKPDGLLALSGRLKLSRITTKKGTTTP